MTDFAELAERLSELDGDDISNAMIVDICAALREAHRRIKESQFLHAEDEKLLARQQDKRLALMAEVERLRALLRVARSIPVGRQGYCSMSFLDLFARIDAELKDKL